MPLAEKALIAQIRRMAGNRPRFRKSGHHARVLAGIGDDCAVLRLPPGYDSLVTTDFSLEGMHFRRDWHPAQSVGHRCLARGLSDIAAMGGEPVAAFLSLTLPRDLPQAWVKEFVRGLIRLAEKHGVTLAGGDTAQSPGGIMADIVVVGTVPKGKAALRSGARPGDGIFVSGALGGSAAVLGQLRAGKIKAVRAAIGKAAAKREYQRHFYPEPRVKLGVALREKGLASAMIDTSDGLSTDLGHICDESGVGAEIDASLVPRAHVGRSGRAVEVELALHGGEDYELLFTVPAGRRVPAKIAGGPVTRIGHVTRGKEILLRGLDGRVSELSPQGWEHFRK